MDNKSLKAFCLIASFYFSAEALAQTTTTDSATREKKIEEVVMIGYGSRKKIDNTAAISSVSGEEIAKTKVLNATQAVQGKVAGVNVIASDLPGSTPTVMIRGLGTVLSGRTPLYVVDGNFVSNLNNINTNDILTFDVLKDAPALAIYGNRGANGVIIVTTKSGRGKMTVDFESFTGVRMPLQKVKMAGSNLFSYYTNTALGSTKFSQDQPVNTDWFDVVTRIGTYNQNNVSVSGSSESVKYFLSLGNYDEKSILKGSDYNRSTVRTNNEFKISKGITLAQNFSVAFTNVTPKPLGVFTTAYKQSPIVPVYFPSGQYGVSFLASNGFASPNGNSSFNNVGNPLAQLNFSNERQNNFLMQGGLKLDVSLMKSLKFTSQFSGEYNNFKSYNFSDRLGQWLAADPTRTAGNYPASDDKDRLSNTKSDYFNWSLSNYLTFSKVFNDVHDVELVAGTEATVKDGINATNVTRRNMGYNSNYWNLGTDDIALNQVVNFSSQRGNRNTTNSYFARGQYKLMNRYLLTASVRRDGSSQFAEGNKWGTFPAFGAGWVISEESFFKGSVFNNLKLRGGWGRLGNQNVPLNLLTFSAGGRNNYSFDGINVNSGSTIDQVFDPNLGWEITEESSLGLDFELLSRKFYGSLDLYDRRTKNIILSLTPIPTSGLSQNGLAHLGEVSNKGLEAVLGFKNKIGQDFSFNVNANFSHNTNKLESVTDKNVGGINGGGLGNGQYTKLFNYTTVGQALGSFWLWEVEGIDANGNFTYVDTNGNGKTGANDLNDRKYFGSYIPKSTYGINLDFRYKSLDLTVNGYGTLGAVVFNGKKAQRFSGENVEYSVATDFWTPTNTNAANPKPFNAVPIASNYYLESGDYFRINNVTLGYTLSRPIEQISSLRLYVSAINPVIFQKFSGFSPELAGSGDPYGGSGIELDAYPTLRSFLFGVNVKF